MSGWQNSAELSKQADETSVPSKGSRPRRKQKACRLESCRSRHYAKGYCKKHYTQVLRHGRLTPERERGVIRICKAPGCSETDTIRYYCRKHARQIRVHGRLTPEREHNMNNEGCSVDGCGGSHRAKGLCAKHYNQRRWQRIKTQRSPRVGSKTHEAGGYRGARTQPAPHIQAFIEPFSAAPRASIRNNAS